MVFALQPKQEKGSTSISFVCNSETVPLLRAATNNDPMFGKGGAEILVLDDTALRPERSASTSFNNIQTRPDAGFIHVYVVREGDTLSQISAMFGVSTNTIIWANDIKGRTIRTGQQLVILPMTGVRHQVQKGDTIESLAKKYYADASEIIRFNNISLSESLSVGDIVDIPDGEIRHAPQTQTARAGQRLTTVENNNSLATGYYLRPINGGVRTQGIHGYNAVDLAAPIGTPILASAPGLVTVSRTGGWNFGYGNYIVINHPNGSQTLYAHNSQNIVSVGQEVVRGQVIGYVGSTGRSTGPHVHFEIRNGPRNPF